MLSGNPKDFVEALKGAKTKVLFAKVGETMTM